MVVVFLIMFLPSSLTISGVTSSVATAAFAQVITPDTFTDGWQIADNEVFIAESLQQIESSAAISIVKIQARQNPEIGIAIHQATQEIAPQVEHRLPEQVNETLTIVLQVLNKEVREGQQPLIPLSSEVVQAVQQAATPSEVIKELVEDEIIKHIANDTGITNQIVDIVNEQQAELIIMEGEGETKNPTEAAQQIITQVQQIANDTISSDITTIIQQIEEEEGINNTIAKAVSNTILNGAIFHIQNAIEAANAGDMKGVLAEAHLAEHALGAFKTIQELPTTAETVQEAMIEDAVIEAAQEKVVAYFLGRGEEQGNKIAIALQELSALYAEL